jgi:cyclase
LARQSLFRVFAFLVCASVFGPAGPSTSATAQSVQMELREIAEDVYVMQHPLGSSNSIFVVTEEGVVVFDSDIRTADQVFAAIRRTTDKPIRYVVVSHPAGDHSTGGWHFREDMPAVIASRTQAKSMAEEETEEFNARKNSPDPVYTPYRNTEYVQPDIVFDGALTLRFGGLTFQITEEGSAHSTSDVTLYIPEKRIFTLGDLFKSEMHTGPGDTVYETFGAAKGWIEIVNSIIERDLAVDTYVPGHGPVHIGRGVEDMQELRRYFVAMRSEISSMIMQGMSEEEVLRDFQTPEEFFHYAQADRVGRFLPYYYRPLKAEMDAR